MKRSENHFKKILYVDGTPNDIGGKETSIEALLFHHKKFVPYILFSDDGYFPQRLKKQGFQNVFTLKVKRLRHLHRSIPAIWQIARFIRRHNIDVVIANHSHAWVYGGLAARMAGVKAVFFIRGIYHPNHFRITCPLGWITAHWPADLYLANSQASLDSLKSRIGNGVRWEVIYSPIDTQRFSLRYSENDLTCLRTELGIPARHQVIVFSGRIQEWKGQEILLRAAPQVLSRHPQTFFLFVGKATSLDQIYYRKLQSLMKDLNIAKNVLFAGFQEDMPLILAMADVLVHASIEPEPFGRVIVEGMAMAKPVIATDAGGPREIIDHGYDGLLVPPGDPTALAESINMLLPAPQLSRQMGLRARKKVEEKFSIGKIIVRLEQTLEELIDKP